MKILLVHRYFWPDTPPYAAMLRHLGHAWTNEGHDVEVFSSQPSYKREVSHNRRPVRESLTGLGVIRARLPFVGDRGAIRRSVNTVMFLGQLVLHMLKHRDIELVVMSTVPQVIGARVATVMCSLTGACFIYHMQDVHPESLRAVGSLRSGLVYRLLRRIDTASCRAASRIVVLSEDMRKTIIARDYVLASRTQIIKNPVMRGYTSIDLAAPTDLLASHGRPRFLFAGNLGRFQDLDSVVDAMIGLPASASDFELVLVGEGRAKERLREKAQRAAAGRVRFIAHQEVDIADALIADADVALITLSKGVAATAFPSKMISYTQAGTALLVAAEDDSELSTLVRQHDLGMAVPNGNPDALREAMQLMAADPQRIKRCGRNARRFFEEMFDDERILADWRDVLSAAPDEAVSA